MSAGVRVGGRPLGDMTTDAVEALRAANDPPTIYARSGELVRVVLDEQGAPHVQRMSEAAVRGALARAAKWTARSKEGRERKVTPPLEVVRDLLALSELAQIPPPLVGITELPIIRPDGSLLTQAGYDDATRLVYAPVPGFRVPTIPPSPTPREVRAARTLILDELLGDFPFVDGASAANAAGLLVSAVVRPMIAGALPLAILDKPRQGTGASYLMEAVVRIATGRPAAMMSAPTEPSEWRKALTAVLLRGATFIVVDNVTRTLESEALALAITAEVYADRVLGESREVRLPVRATWITTGNNVCVAGDMPRRCYWVRLDAGLEYPEDRPAGTFQHPDLLGWVAAHRAQLVAAVLTLARHWIAEGRPATTAPTWGGFGGFVEVVGGILEAAEIDGFLRNRATMRDRLDEEATAWRVFIRTWAEQYAHAPQRVRDVADHLRADDARGEALRAVLPPTLPEPTDPRFRQRLGLALKARADQVFGDLRLTRAEGDTHAKVGMWQVVQAGTCGDCGTDPDPYARARGTRGNGAEQSPRPPQSPQRDLDDVLEVEP